MTRTFEPAPATIAVLGGDGVGPEVVAAGRRVLEAVADRFGFALAFVEGLIGGAAIDATGSPLPDETMSLSTNADAVLLGAVGGPRWDSPAATVRPEQGLLGIRRALGLFANIRPVRCRPTLTAQSPFRAGHLDGVDFVVVRELTGGIYFGDKSRESAPGGERASDLCSYTTDEITRITRVAGQLARQREGRLISVDKANVLETSRLWRQVVARVVAEEFPDVELAHMLVDTCAMQLILRPRAFDVIVTENMFGDILTDEAAALAGSIGLLPSASIGAGRGGVRRGLYEPIHGSAPDIAGRGWANPVGTILSAAMLLRHSLNREAEARAVEDAVERVIARGLRTRDLVASPDAFVSTETFSAAVVEAIADWPVARNAADGTSIERAAPAAGG